MALVRNLEWRRLLSLLLLLAAAGVGGWLGWLTHEPQPTLVLRAPLGHLQLCHFSADGKELVTERLVRNADLRAIEREFLVWNLSTGTVVERIALPKEIGPDELRGGPEFARRIAVRTLGTPDIEVYQIRPWKRLNTTPLDAVKGSVFMDGLRFHAEHSGGRWLAMRHQHQKVEATLLLDLEQRVPPRKLLGSFARFSQDGETTLTVSDEGDLCFWRNSDGGLTRRSPKPADGQRWYTNYAWDFHHAPAVLLDAHSRWLIEPLTTGYFEVALQCRDLSTGQVAWTLGSSSELFWCAERGSCFVTTGPQAPVLLWKSTGGEKPTLLCTLQPAVKLAENQAWPKEQHPIASRHLLAVHLESPLKPGKSWIEKGIEWWKDLLGATRSDVTLHELSLCDMQAGQEVLRLRHQFEYWDLAASPCGRRAAFQTAEGEDEFRHLVIHVWSLPQPFPWLRTLIAATLPVVLLALLMLGWRRLGRTAPRSAYPG